MCLADDIMNNIKYVSQTHNMGRRRSQKQAFCHVLSFLISCVFLRHVPAEPFNMHMLNTVSRGCFSLGLKFLFPAVV